MDWDEATRSFAAYLTAVRGYSPRTVAVYLAEVAGFRAGLVARRDPPLPPARIDTIEVRRHLAALFGTNDAATIGK